jgi:elongation factor Ts
MATITASMVNELRAKTGQPMMECKKMLNETGGDIAAAERKFREKGVKTSVLERAANEGRVFVATSSDAKRGAIVEINCNTDFTAKSEELAAVGNKAIKKLLDGAADITSDAEVKADLTALSQKTGENVQLGRNHAVTGEHVGAYLYSTAGKGKTAALMAFSGGGNEEISRLTGMHIVAAKPIALHRSEVPADVVTREKEIAVEQAKASGKPQQIAEKIAEGKMNAFYGERVLLDQDFINGEVFKGKVADMLKSKGATLTKYVRVEVGQA